MVKKTTLRQQNTGGTSVIYVVDYILGLAIFGIFYAMWNGILTDISVVSTESIVYDFVNMIWTGTLVIYLMLGPFWLLNRIREIRR